MLHDVTTGNNSVVCAQYSTDCGSNGFLTGYDAVTGYDLATGLGSVDVAQMVSNWNSVTLTPTTTALTIGGSTSPVTATHGTNLHFQIAVNPTAATGDAALIANNSSVNGLLSVPLASGAGAVTYNGLPGGQYTVYARYGGDTGDAASSSAPITVNISKEDSTTAISVNVYDGTTGATLPSNSPIPYGSYLFLDATVYGKAEGQTHTQGIATGTIAFDDGSAAIGTSALNSTGYASLSSYTLKTYPLNAGTHSLAASFQGDNSYDASTSTAVPINITKATPQVQIAPTAASTSTATYDLIQVVINEAGVGLTASGTVTLQSNGKTLGTAPLVDTGFQTSTGLAEDVGLATFNVSGSQLQPGVDTLTATYGGDVNYGAGTGTTPLVVSQATFALTTSPISLTAGATTANTAPVRLNPLDYFTGTVNLKCTVTSAPANAIDPVTCSIPASVSISGLNAVTTTLTVNSVPPTSSGTYLVTVTGVDAASGKVTSSATSTVTVTGTVPLLPAIAIANSGAITIAAGATTNNTSTVSITPANGFTGAVDLKCTVSTTPTGANDPVTCSLSSSSVKVSGTGASTVTLSVASKAPTTAALGRAFGAGNALLALLLVFVPGHRRRRLASLACAFALIAIVGVVSGCGGNKSPSGGGGSTPPPTTIPGTTAGVYAVTVTATGTSVTDATTTVKVTVN